ncbi:BEM_collapsed_G0002140.mRNA.1.CDS.1 [Saccharomyces cerevisiae]|nr:BEM_collapsed_G0002140.mRNA.1.CDS.1 [Saccharomyces cerevisiae]
MIVGLTLYFVLFRSIQQFDTSTSLLLNELCSSPSEINSYWNKYFGISYYHGTHLPCLKGWSCNRKCFIYLSGIVLYFLTKKIFSQNIRQSQFARTIAKKTSLLFFLTSAAGFLTSIYSEPLSFFFAFVGIWSRECSISVPVLGQFDIPWRYWFPYSFISMTCFLP